MTFEVIVDKDRAQATSEKCALYAARTLVNENSRAYGSARMLRNEIIVTRDGMYDGKLTMRARRGE